MGRRAIAYIDGHNFYHGVVKDCPEYKWLDVAALSRSLLRGYNVVEVNYYTAKVIDFPDDPTQSQRQDRYNRALAGSGINVVYGQFQKNEKPVRLIDGTRARAVIYEEKGSDVNLGTDLSWDAAERRMEAALVFSNDFDLQRPVERAQAKGIEVVIVNPHQGRKRGAERQETSATKQGRRRPTVNGTDTRSLTARHLRACQLPDIVFGLDGAELRRPKEWR